MRKPEQGLAALRLKRNDGAVMHALSHRSECVGNALDSRITQLCRERDFVAACESKYVPYTFFKS